MRGCELDMGRLGVREGALCPEGQHEEKGELAVWRGVPCAQEG